MARKPVFTLLHLILALSMTTSLRAASSNDRPMGWASMGEGTTGGAGGTEVTVTDMADLKKYARMEGKYIIWVSGSMGDAGARGGAGGDTVVVASDKSILGLPGAAVSGCFKVVSVRNVIMRNLKILGPGAFDVDGPDAVHVENNVINAWFDHLDISDGADGNLDITRGSDLITVSWTKFSYTDKSYVSNVTDSSHRYCNLIGHDNKNVAQDTGHLKVSLYKVWWAQGVAERMPRVRFGKVHVANCLFTSTDPGQSHCVRPAIQSDVLVESNAFIGQKNPLDLAFDSTFTAATERNNLYSNCTGNVAGRGVAFTPPYAALDFTAPAMLQAELSETASGAGATLTWTPTGLAVPGNQGKAYFMDGRPGTEGKIFNGTTRAMDVLVLDVSGRERLRLGLRPGESRPIPAQGKAVANRSIFLQTSAR